MGGSFRPTNSPSHGDLDPRLIHSCLGPSEPINPNGISIGSVVRDRPTDHANPSVTIGRIGLRMYSTAMRLNKVVKVIRQKAALPPCMYGRFSRIPKWRRCATHVICSSLGPCTPSPQLARHLDRFRRFCTTHGRVHILYNWAAALNPPHGGQITAQGPYIFEMAAIPRKIGHSVGYLNPPPIE